MWTKTGKTSKVRSKCDLSSSPY